MALDYTTGTTIMMQLGSFQFGIATAAYQELSRASEMGWAELPRFGLRPALQFTGPGAETMDLPGVIYPEWRGGFGQLDAMRALAEAGKPLRLVDGSGASLGQWVIASVGEKQSVFAAAGKPRKVEFTLALKRYLDDAAPAAGTAFGATSLIAGALSGSATAGLTLPAVSLGSVAQVNGLAGQVASQAKSLGSTITAATSAVQAQASAIANVSRDVLGAVNRAASVAGQLQTVANMALKAVGAKPVNITAIAAAQNMATTAARMTIQAESATKLLRSATETLAGTGGVTASATKAVQSAATAADSIATLARKTASLSSQITG